MLASDSLAHLTEFLLLLGAFVGPVQDPRYMIPVKDKARALVLFASEGDASEYRRVLAAIRREKEKAETSLASLEKGVKEIEAGLRNDASLLEKAGDLAPSIARRMEASQRTLMTFKNAQVRRRQRIEGRVQEEKAFTRVYGMLDQEQERGLRSTLLARFLSQLDAILGPESNLKLPLPISAQEKARALLLFAKKGDASEHRKVLTFIGDRKAEARAKIDKFTPWVKDLEDQLRDAQAELVKTAGDTSAVQKRIDGTRRSLKIYTDLVAALRQHLKDRDKEVLAWTEALRLIDKGRKLKKR